MTTSTHLRNITLDGATGNLGQQVLPHLLASTNPPFHITVLTRPTSTSTSSLPTTPNLTIVHVSPDDTTALTSTLQGQDALVILLAFTAPPAHTTNLIRAAAAAEVPYVLPTEFGSDTANAALVAQVPMLRAKVGVRAIRDLGVSRPIAIITNPWLDYGLREGLLGIDVRKKKATMYTGHGPDAGFTAHTTTLAQAGRAVAGVLSLPREQIDAFENGFVYVNSFRLKQRDVLAAVQRVTGTEGWVVEETALEERLQLGRDMIARGERAGSVLFVVSEMWAEDGGFEGELSNELLGLPVEDLDAVVRGIVQGIESA